MFDCIIKGGRVIDPFQKIDTILDLAIKGNKICSLDKDIKANKTHQVFDVKGKLIMPGLIDFHTHVYWGGTSLSIDSNKIGPKTGVTTFVDAGSSGAGNFLGFKYYIIDPSILEIFAFINISYVGISCLSKYFDYGESKILDLLNIPSVVDMIKKFPKIIKGIKVRVGYLASGNLELIPLYFALKASEISNKPLMVHIDEPPPTTEQVISYLRKGDIITHSFRGGPNKFIDTNGKILSGLLRARERGVLIDIGHGSGSFSFDVSKKMIDAKFYPDIISSDLHMLSIKKPVIDLPTTMSKFINLGMPLSKVILACTYVPASVISEEKEIGHLKIGSIANISIFELKKGNYEFYDAYNNKLIGTEKLFPIMTFKSGKLIYSCLDKNN